MKNDRDNIKRKSKTSKTNTNKSNLNDNQNDEQKNFFKTNYQSSEAIIKCFLDKIISSVVRSTQAKELDKQLGNFCFNIFQKQFTSLFETNFINYTDDLSHNEPKLLWELTPPPENTWVEILEPGTQGMDRYESSNIAFVEIKKEQEQESPLPTITVSSNSNEKMNLNKITNKNKKGKKESEPLSWNNNNIIDEVEEKSSFSGFDGEMEIKNGAIPEVSGIEDKFSESLNMTDAEIKKNIDNAQELVQNEKEKKDINIGSVVNEKEENNKKIDINNNIKKEEKKDNVKSTTSNQIKNKGKNIPIPDYSFSDIPGVEEEYNHQNLEPQNVEFLRREREELIQKRINENKLKENSNKIIKPVEDDRIKKKLIDSNRFSFDSNGNIIHFRPYKFDNLSKDFVITKNTIRALENKSNNNNNNNLSNKKRNLFNKDKDKKEKEIVQEEIIKNIEEEIKTKPINDIVNNANTEKGKFIPSGSNFEIISPNIGVVIKENHLEKEGSKEFSKYFKKYSIRDYNKMLNDFVPLQNRTMLQNHINSSNNTSKYLSTEPNNNTYLNKKSSILSHLDSNNNINMNSTEIPGNPLLSNEDQSSYFMDKDKSINNSGFNSNINSNLNNPLLPSNMNSINLDRYNGSYNSINMDNSIVMKRLGTGSLKLELDSLKDLSTINSEVIKIPNKRKNILGTSFIRNNKIKIKPILDKNNFNEFNKKIMVTQGWGNDRGDLNAEFKEKNNNGVYSRHITKQQVLRELGSNILSGIKIRLPRDRKVDINSNI